MKAYYPSIILFLLLLLASLSAAFGQTQLIAISGVVREKGTGEALPGVSISIKNANTGTQSDVDGRFALKAKLSF